MKKLAYSVLGIGGVLALLIVAKGILIPFAYGIILWFLGRYFKDIAYRIPLVRNHLPRWLVSAVIFLFTVLVLFSVSAVISSNVEALMLSYPSYQANVDVIVQQINSRFEFDLYENIKTTVSNIEIGGLLQRLADMLSGIFGDLVMVLLYAVFIISEEASFSTKFKKLFKNETDLKRATTILNRIYGSVSDYIRLKTYVSLLTGVVGYLFLFLMGVDAPFFWALLIFLLNYIPTIGSLVATLFPAVFSLVQFGEFTPFVIILLGLGAVEWFIGNVLEPKIMGSSLNISPLVTILSLVVWGQIWGITGMLLSVPITVVLVIVLSQFERTKSIAILLSENGEID